jgi:hypothetical protein
MRLRFPATNAFVQLESIRNEDEESADGCPICQESFGQRGAKEIVILNCLHRVSQSFDCFPQARVSL